MQGPGAFVPPIKVGAQPIYIQVHLIGPVAAVLHVA
jgi:hypothetical protein